MVEKIIILVLIGLLTGTITAISAGSGVMVVVPLLAVILGYTMHAAIGTATALMAISAASGVVGYTLQGHIPWLDGIIIGLAAMASGALFSKVANRATEKTLNTAVGAIFIAIGVAMFFVEGGTAGVLHSVQALLS